MRRFHKSAGAFGAALALLLLPALPGRTADFAFNGTLAPTDVRLFGFTVTANPFVPVTLRTSSYAAGGFDPVLSLFRGDGLLLDANDDVNALVSSAIVPADPIIGNRFDSYFQIDLEPGSYTLALTYSPNYAVGPNLADGFAPVGPVPGGRTSSFAVGIGNVTAAAEVPETGAGALAAAGLPLLAGTLRRRRKSRTVRI